MNRSQKSKQESGLKSLPENAQKIEQLIEQLNDAWLNDKLDNMEKLFHKRVVMIVPGTNRKIRGRELMIESYREFIEMSDVSDFRVQNMVIDVFDTTAVALYNFRIRYRVETTNYDENGVETLVLHRHNDRWLIVWRTQQPALQN